MLFEQIFFIIKDILMRKLKQLRVRTRTSISSLLGLTERFFKCLVRKS